MNSAPGVPSDAGTDFGTDVGIIVTTTVDKDVGFVVGTDVGLVVGTVVGIVVPGVGIAGMSVVSFPISFVSFAAGVGLGESELTHPLNKTIPVTRTIKNGLHSIFSFPGL
jgi:hypothetical protein